MCNCKSDLDKIKKLVDYSYKQHGERWVVIENKSGRLETIPEKSLEKVQNEVTLIYKIEEK